VGRTLAKAVIQSNKKLKNEECQGHPKLSKILLFLTLQIVHITTTFKILIFL
jgi:hypothetical protein